MSFQLKSGALYFELILNFVSHLFVSKYSLFVYLFGFWKKHLSFSYFELRSHLIQIIRQEKS